MKYNDYSRYTVEPMVRIDGYHAGYGVYDHITLDFIYTSSCRFPCMVKCFMENLLEDIRQEFLEI